MWSLHVVAVAVVDVPVVFVALAQRRKGKGGFGVGVGLWRRDTSADEPEEGSRGEEEDRGKEHRAWFSSLSFPLEKVR